MKEIKAYIKCSKVETVVQELRKIGVENMTIIDVMALGRSMVDPQSYKYSIECVDKYSNVAKIELICADQDADEIIDVIRSEAYSGEPGDGIIIMSDVNHAIKIRTGDTGSGFLQPKRTLGSLPENN